MLLCISVCSTKTSGTLQSVTQLATFSVVVFVVFLWHNKRKLHISKEEVMGRWWKKVSALPAGKGIIIEGNQKAWGKQIPLWWRLRNPWVFLKVENHLPYRLYFDDGEECRLFKSILYTPFIAIRTGPNPICFLAIGTFRGAERELIEVAEEQLTENLDDSFITYV